MSDIFTESMEYWQARFNVLCDAWNTGDNNAVLKATHEFIKANDNAPTMLKLLQTSKLQAEIDRLSNVLQQSRVECDHLRDSANKLEDLERLVRDFIHRWDSPKTSWKDVAFIADMVSKLRVALDDRETMR